MPTATDLVTDLPADFEVFGQAVATSLADLLGGTTGQILAKNSATDMDFTWIANDQGDITGVTAGTGISGGGTSGTVTVTNSMATAYTTKGDLVPATASATFARLGVGANDTVLTADSTAATGMKWSAPVTGGMTQLATGSFSGASVSLTSISGSYRSLYLVIQNWLPVTANASLRGTFNSDTNTRYANEIFASNAFTYSEASFRVTQGQSNSVAQGLWTMEIPEYANAVTWKMSQVNGGGNNTATTTTNNTVMWNNFYNQLPAITSIQLFPSSGNHTSGTYTLYGVK